jgi:hypothetical protein
MTHPGSFLVSHVLESSEMKWNNAAKCRSTCLYRSIKTFLNSPISPLGPIPLIRAANSSSNRS